MHRIFNVLAWLSMAFLLATALSAESAEARNTAVCTGMNKAQPEIVVGGTAKPGIGVAAGASGMAGSILGGVPGSVVGGNYGQVKSYR